ncbi:transmembrane protein [Cordyceps javanica]|uniref:Store-operated calcium entry-associated regulatory factor n=1 Tax=Cordyceps javanica TaxID=43265 RepID=A0A545W9V8_9HYPO|nr:transmembrane protein [Cordyceps javanica]TQW10722.1 transmembrane protein [Cordyceps javanica]
MHLTRALLLSLGLAASTASAKRASPAAPRNAVLLSDVQSLTLRGGGAKTTHRRVAAAPQLRCVSPKALCRLHSVDVMRCTNQGASYGDEDVEWSCAASLPPELKLGATDVICEGYASSDDPYVLKGSCGVEYTLALTAQGERRYPELARGDRWFGNGDGDDGRGGTDPSAWLFAVIFVAVFAWIAYSACVAGSDNNRRQGHARRFGDGGGGWGGGGGGDGPGGGGWGPRNDPPPPYPGSNNSYKSSSNGAGAGGAQQQQGWRPGFWTGLASGAAATYLAGGHGRDNRNNYGYTPWGASNYGSGSRWGGGDSRAGPSSSSRNGGSASGERHESTGFGSTRRR